MDDKETPEPQYKAPPLGAYPVDEHLRAQREQTDPRTDKPLHEEVDGEDDAPGE